MQRPRNRNRRLVLIALHGLFHPERIRRRRAKVRSNSDREARLLGGGQAGEGACELAVKGSLEGRIVRRLGD